MHRSTALARANQAYDRMAITLHWSSAVLILTNLAIGLRMEQFPGFAHTSAPWSEALLWHGSIGATILALTLARIAWRLTHRYPPLPADLPPAQAMAAHGVHALLIAVCLALPLSGYLHRAAGGHPVTFFEWWNWPNFIGPNEALRVVTDKVHVALAFILASLVLVHLAGVLKHLLVDRDGLPRRMAPGGFAHRPVDRQSRGR